LVEVELIGSAWRRDGQTLPDLRSDQRVLILHPSHSDSDIHAEFVHEQNAELPDVRSHGRRELLQGLGRGVITRFPFLLVGVALQVQTVPINIQQTNQNNRIKSCTITGFKTVSFILNKRKQEREREVRRVCTFGSGKQDRVRSELHRWLGHTRDLRYEPDNTYIYIYTYTHI